MNLHSILLNQYSPVPRARVARAQIYAGLGTQYQSLVQNALRGVLGTSSFNLYFTDRPMLRCKVFLSLYRTSEPALRVCLHVASLKAIEVRARNSEQGYTLYWLSNSKTNCYFNPASAMFQKTESEKHHISIYRSCRIYLFLELTVDPEGILVEPV